MKEKRTNYSKMELDLMFKEQAASSVALKEIVVEGFKGTHARQDIANGRTGKLENWQAFMKGGLAILSILFVPVLIYFLTHWK